EIAPPSATVLTGQQPESAPPLPNRRARARRRSAPPSANGCAPEAPAALSNDRDARGRFRTGNPGGPGNPFGRQYAQLRQTLFDVVTPQAMRTLAQDLLCQASLGNLPALRLLLLYTVGRPVEPADPDRVNVEEWKLTRESIVGEEQLVKALAGMKVEAASALAR